MTIRSGAISNPGNLWKYLLLPENVFYQFPWWNPRNDITTVNISSKQQRYLLLNIDAKNSASLVWKSVVILFVLFTLYQLLWGTFQNIRYSFTLDDNTEHTFHYGLIVVYLDFWRQPHLILTVHSIAGTFFLLSCMLQTSLAKYVLTTRLSKFHRRLGYFVIINSLIASICATWLSYKALYGTNIIYLLGTASWLIFTLMTIIRALQKQWISHSRWALALQQAGIMFVTTRLYAPILILLGFNTPDMYYWSVWAAGISAFVFFGLSEKSRQTTLQNIFKSSNPSSKMMTGDASYLFPRVFLSRGLNWTIAVAVFVGSPLLRYTTLFDQWINPDVFFITQAVVLLSFYLLSVTSSLMRQPRNK